MYCRRAVVRALALHQRLSRVAYSEAAAAAAADKPVTAAASPVPGPSAKVVQLADQILALNLLEGKELSELLKEKLGLPKGQAPMMGMPMAMPMAVPQAAPAAAAAPAAQAAPAASAEAKPAGKPDAKGPAKKEEGGKREVDVRLDAFPEANKVKVIKEVRTFTNLGLKEAKEAIEKLPFIVKAKCPTEDAEKIKQVLTELGATVTFK
eukprot:RCo049483